MQGMRKEVLEKKLKEEKGQTLKLLGSKPYTGSVLQSWVKKQNASICVWPFKTVHLNLHYKQANKIVCG